MNIEKQKLKKISELLELFSQILPKAEFETFIDSLLLSLKNGKKTTQLIQKENEF